MNTEVITIKKNHLFLVLGVVVAVSVFVGGFLAVRAAFIQPEFTPGASDQDFPQNILGANNADNDFNSNAVLGNPDGSIIERLQGIQDDYVSNFYSSLTKPMRYMAYDDWNCWYNNEGRATSSCAASDPEYTGEEGQWASTTDTSLGGALVASGIVKKDERTGLYWSDCYDSVSGGGSCNTRANEFNPYNYLCTDAEINSGTCDINAVATSSQAITFCQNLVLDKDGDSVDDTDWYLPSQKELMLAYISGAANNLPNPSGDYYWSSTENYNTTANTWFVGLGDGVTSNGMKVLFNYARCIHR